VYNAKQRPLRGSRSFNTFSINRKPHMLYYFLVVNTNLHPISHRFQSIVDYWLNLNFRCRQGAFFFKIQACEIWPEDIAPLYGQSVFRILISWTV